MAQSYYPRRMRVVEKEEKQLIRRLIITVFLIVVLGIALFFGGVPALLSLANFFGKSSNNTTQTNNQDQTPILSPQLDPLAIATNSAHIAITGSGQAGDSVLLFENNQQVNQQLIGKDGTFSFANIQLREGTNDFYAKVQAPNNGKTSTASDTEEIIFDTTPPQLTVASPQDNQTVSGQNSLPVNGKTDPNTTVTVNNAIATVGSDGSFGTTITLQPGAQQIKIVATDQAGNQTTVTRNVTFNP